MPTGYISITPTIDGYVNRLAEASWGNAHDDNNGEASNYIAQYHATGLRSSFTAAGRGSGYYVSRCFFSFDTRGIFNIPKSGTLGIQGYSNANANIIYCVKATSDIEGAISNADFDSIEGWDHDADNTSTGTIYAPETSSWIVGTNLFTLNSQALADIVGQDRFNVCLLTNRDILDNGESFPAPSSTHYSGLYFSNHGTAFYRPTLKLLQQDDSVFFGANF